MNYITPITDKPRCLFRRVEFETIAVKIDGHDAGALRWDRKRGWLPDAELEQTLGVHLPAEAWIGNSRDAKDYVRVATTLIPPPQETTP